MLFCIMSWKILFSAMQKVRKTHKQLWYTSIVPGRKKTRKVSGKRVNIWRIHAVLNLWGDCLERSSGTPFLLYNMFKQFGEILYLHIVEFHHLFHYKLSTELMEMITRVDRPNKTVYFTNIGLETKMLASEICSLWGTIIIIFFTHKWFDCISSKIFDPLHKTLSKGWKIKF